MVAMNSATPRCFDLVDHLIIIVNKFRQANITREILETISSYQSKQQT